MASSLSLAMREAGAEQSDGVCVCVGVIRVIWRMSSWGRETHELEVHGRGVGEKS